MTIYHLVISGGGPLGLRYLGALQYLEKNGYWSLSNIESIYATSIGSIIAVFLCLNFDWETLKIITKNFHNPHYHEYMKNRTNEDVVVVNQCELPEYYLIKKYLTNKNIQFFDMALENIHRANLELAEVITTFQINNYPPTLNQWSRIQYILGDMSEQKFKDEIYKKDREQKKLIAFRQIYEMFIMVTRDIFHQILVSDSALFDQFISAIEYFNENIALKAKQFNTTSYRIIDVNYNLVYN